MWEKYFQKTFLQWNFWLHGVNTLGLACSPRVHHQFMMSRNCRYSRYYRFSKYSRSTSRSNAANKFKWYCRSTTWFGLFEFFNVHCSMFMHWVVQLSLINLVAIMPWSGQKCLATDRVFCWFFSKAKSLTKIICYWPCFLLMCWTFYKAESCFPSHLTAAARSARSKGVILEQIFLPLIRCTHNKVESSW